MRIFISREKPWYLLVDDVELASDPPITDAPSRIARAPADRYGCGIVAYVIEGHARSGIDGGHWFIGGGNLSVLQQQFFSVSKLAAAPSAAPCPHGQLRRYEDDGASMSSGHVVVLCRPGRTWYFASIHGHENADLATALAQEVARGVVATR